MIRLVSAIAGTGVALLLLGASLSNGVSWLESLFRAAIAGGVMALVAQRWFRVMHRASQKAEASKAADSASTTDDKPHESAGHASH